MVKQFRTTLSWFLSLAFAGVFAPAQEVEPSPLLAKADSVLTEMSHITGLPVRGALKKQIISRAQVRHYLTENLHAEYTPEEIHIQQAELQAFGLVSQEFNLEKFLINF